MDGGLAPDILASIVEKVQVRILMSLWSFLADYISWFGNNVCYYRTGAMNNASSQCGMYVYCVSDPAAFCDWSIACISSRSILLWNWE